MKKFAKVVAVTAVGLGLAMSFVACNNSDIADAIEQGNKMYLKGDCTCLTECDEHGIYKYTYGSGSSYTTNYRQCESCSVDRGVCNYKNNAAYEDLKNN